MSDSTAANSSVHDQLTPHLVCDPCADAIEFYKKGLGAEEMYRLGTPDGKKIMHAALRIGESMLFLADDFPEYCDGASQSPKALGGTPVTIHRNVEDCDAAIKKAEEAGATVLMPATDMFWGDRYGVVTDPFGHKWSFSKHLKEMTPAEIEEAMKQSMPPA